MRYKHPLAYIWFSLSILISLSWVAPAAAKPCSIVFYPSAIADTDKLISIGDEAISGPNAFVRRRDKLKNKISFEEPKSSEFEISELIKNRKFNNLQYASYETYPRDRSKRSRFAILNEIWYDDADSYRKFRLVYFDKNAEEPIELFAIKGDLPTAEVAILDYLENSRELNCVGGNLQIVTNSGRKYPSQDDPALIDESPDSSAGSGTEPNFGGQPPKAKMTLSEIRSLCTLAGNTDCDTVQGLTDFMGDDKRSGSPNPKKRKRPALAK